MAKKREIFLNGISDQVGENCEAELKHSSTQAKTAHNRSMPPKAMHFFLCNSSIIPQKDFHWDFFPGCDLISVAK